MDPRRTSAPTLAVLVGICLLFLFFGLRSLTSELPDEPLIEESAGGCVNVPVKAGEPVRPESVLVSVYNGGGEAGLASKAMSALQARGFAPGKTGNVTDSGVKRAQVWADEADNPAALLVARQFGSDIAVKTGHEPLTDGIVVVVGNDFTGLAKGAPQELSAERDAEICSPFS